jgi:hypothetical protein
MTSNLYDQVCYRTEQRDEHLALVNMRTGELGRAFGCTPAGETVQVELPDGRLDSWSRDDCREAPSAAWLS